MNIDNTDELIGYVNEGYSLVSNYIKRKTFYKKSIIDIEEESYIEYILYFKDEEVSKKTLQIGIVFSFIDMIREYKMIRRNKLLTELGI